MKLFFTKLISVLFILLLGSFCEDKKDLPKPKYPIDLNRQISQSKTENFKFDEKIDIVSHWKKNPSRFSGLDSKTKWLNTQMTFNTDKSAYINHSQDSILLNPQASIEFKIEPGIYTLRFDAGLLSSGLSGKGNLELIVDNKPSPESIVKIEKEETWFNFERKIRINHSLKFKWGSDNSFGFIAHPILMPDEFKNTKNNIILFVIDALRADSLSFSGLKFPTSPNIDQLAEESVVFSKAFVNANWTKPSMLSMFYSDYASNLGIGNIGFDVSPAQKKIFYRPSRKNLIQVLRENHYYTASIMNNVFLLDYTGVGFDLGFHELIQIGKDIEDTKRISEETIQFLNRNSHSPFFLHINFNTPHGSYEPPSKVMIEMQQETDPKNWFKENPTIRRYYGEIRYADQELGKIIEELKARQLYDTTTIVLTADHGELFSDHHTHLANGIYGVKYGHGMTHFEEEIHVPYLIKPAKSISHKILSKKIDKPVSLLSITPTILGVSNVPYSKKDFKGMDYSHFLFGETFQAEESIFTEGRLSESVRTDKFKYIRFYPGYTNSQLAGRYLMSDELDELYDLESDSDEKQNLAKESSFFKKAESELEKHSNLTNSFHIIFPPKKESDVYSGNIFVQGAIYKIRNQKEFGIKIQNKRNFSFEFKGNNQEREIIIDTVQPDFNFSFSLYLNQKSEKYRVGKWGIVNTKYLETYPQLLVSNSKPSVVDNLDLPLIYNDAKLSGEKEVMTSSAMSDEVRQILKSWGYIHE